MEIFFFKVHVNKPFIFYSLLCELSSSFQGIFYISLIFIHISAVNNELIDRLINALICQSDLYSEAHRFIANRFTHIIKVRMCWFIIISMYICYTIHLWGSKILAPPGWRLRGYWRRGTHRGDFWIELPLCVCVLSLSLSVLIKGSKYERWVECKCIVVNVLQLWMQMYCNWIRKKVCYYAIDNCFCISFLLNKLMFLIVFFKNKLVYKCLLMNVIWFLRTYLVIRQRTGFKRTIIYLFQVGRLYVHVLSFKT